jgi:hypothetical protein
VTPREVLLKAAEHIERYGWRQRSKGAPEAPCCVIGAMEVVTEDDRAAFDEARFALRGRVGWQLVAWNDAPGRTAAEVITALRGAAEESPS